MSIIQRIQSFISESTQECREASLDIADEDSFEYFDQASIPPARLLLNQCARLIRTAHLQRRSLSQFEYSAFPKG